LDEAGKAYSIAVFPVMSYLFFPLFFGGEYLEKFNNRLKKKLSTEEEEALRHFVHAEAFETSAMLHLKPHLVDKAYKTLKPVVFDYDKMFEELKKLDDWEGYVGIPSKSRAEIGEAVITTVGEECADLVLRWHRGEDVGKMRRYPEGLVV
jgi:creatinine amidohydrolase/Fe(II)-dependent formamide hydrolase-like protein